MPNERLRANGIVRRGERDFAQRAPQGERYRSSRRARFCPTSASGRTVSFVEEHTICPSRASGRTVSFVEENMILPNERLMANDTTRSSRGAHEVRVSREESHSPPAAVTKSHSNFSFYLSLPCGDPSKVCWF